MSTRTIPEITRIRQAYGYLRTYFRQRNTDYADLQASLNAAHIPMTASGYLAQTAVWMIGVGLVGFVIGSLLGAVLAMGGVFEAITVPTGLTGVARFLGRYELVATAVLVGGGFGTVMAGSYWRLALHRPRAVAAQRRREIDVFLPHAILFMYALSEAGIGLVEIFRTLAAADDAYGEVASEFEVMLREMDEFNTDLVSALGGARERTPSDRLSRFIDDGLGVIDSGGAFTAMLEGEIDTYLREAREEQRRLIETLSLVAEGYVTLLVAGPLFLIITLLVIGLLGGETTAQAAVVIYVGIPLGSVFIILAVDQLFGTITESPWTLSTGQQPPDAPVDDARTQTYLRHRRVKSIRDRLTSPIESFTHRPVLSMVISVPVVGLVLVGGWMSGVTTPSVTALTTRPIIKSIKFAILPFLGITIPVAIFYERRSRRVDQAIDRFPEVLNAISNVSKIGLSFPEAMGLVARRRDDPLGHEMRLMEQDMVWNGDVSGAVARSANRMQAPGVSRVAKLIIEAYRAGGDIHRTLQIAAQNAANQRQLQRERRQEVFAYLAIIIIGFLVYLGVIILLDQFYLEGIGNALDSTAQGPDDPGIARSFLDLDTNVFRLLFFHSAIVQAVFSGLVAGKMTHNTVLSGLKFSISLVILTTVVFLIL